MTQEQITAVTRPELLVVWKLTPPSSGQEAWVNLAALFTKIAKWSQHGQLEQAAPRRACAWLTKLEPIVYCALMSIQPSSTLKITWEMGLELKPEQIQVNTHFLLSRTKYTSTGVFFALLKLTHFKGALSFVQRDVCSRTSYRGHNRKLAWNLLLSFVCQNSSNTLTSHKVHHVN